MEFTKDIRNPMKNMVLLTNGAFGLNQYFPFHYDAVFKAHDGNDWTMIVTYLSYVVKPVFVVCDIAVPDVVWKKIGKDITFVHLMNNMPLSSMRPYQCIFFAEDADSCRVLQTVYRGSYSVSENKEIVQELRVAGAGLVWCSINEAPSGALYWYDPVSYQQVTLSKGQLSELFGWLSSCYKE